LLEGEGVSERPLEYDGPTRGPNHQVFDDLHDEDGNHLTKPPPGSNPRVWANRRRKHLEGHETDAMVRKIAPNLFPPTPPRRIG
jgi:hypothetical protein